MLQALKPEEIAELLRRALRDKRGFGDQVVHIGDDLLEAIANFANGDARTALSTLEMVVLNGEVGSDGSTHRHGRDGGAVHLQKIAFV